MNANETVDPLDVRAKGLRGTLPGEDPLGPVAGGRLWPARVRLRMMGAILLGATPLALFFLWVCATSDVELMEYGGGVAFLCSQLVGVAGFVAVGIVLLTSTSTLRSYRRRLPAVFWMSSAICLLSLAGAWGIREAPSSEGVAFPLAYASIFFLIAVLAKQECGPVLGRGRKGGGSDVV